MTIRHLFIVKDHLSYLYKGRSHSVLASGGRHLEQPRLELVCHGKGDNKEVLGAGEVHAEEKDGSLDAILSLPIPR